MSCLTESEWESMSNQQYMEAHMRRCHDCQRKTWDYRCSSCDAKWRRKHGLPPREVENPRPYLMDEA